MIAKAVELVNQAKLLDKPLRIDRIPIADKKTYKMLSLGLTTGVFQVESLGMTQLVKKLKPNTFEDIIALVALFRPGPLGSGMVDDFVERKHGRQEIRYLHPLLKPILKDTYGMILYQEQVQKIAATLASYSLGEADLLRRAMGKKIPEEMAKQKDRFLSGAKDNKIASKLAEEIFDLMAEFAKYGFNKSHSAAYGLVSYQTAYLKCYFPEHFLAATMTCDLDNTDKIKRYIEECHKFAIDLRAPCINSSILEFSVPKKGVIYFGLSAIKGVGEMVLKPILANRDLKGPFKNLTDLASRVDLARVGKKTLQLLIESGALDSFGLARKTLLNLVITAVKYSSDLHAASSLGQRSLFDMVEETTERVQEAPWDEQTLTKEQHTKIFDADDLFAEKKLLGAFISAHPMEYYTSDVHAFGTTIEHLSQLAVSNPENRKNLKKKVEIVALLSACNHRRTKKGSLMASIRLEQGPQYIESVIFERDLQVVTLPPLNTVVLATGSVDKDDSRDLVRFQIEKIEPIEQVRTAKVKKLFLKIPCNNTSQTNSIADIYRFAQNNQGSVPMVFQVMIGKAQVVIAADEKLAVEPSDALLLGLKSLAVEDLSVEYHAFS